MKKQLFLFLLLSVWFSFGYCQSGANYNINFTSNWSQATHPHTSGNLPSNAHWSKLVGATHSDQITFWEPGGTATQGVEDIAEQGSNTAFFNEVNAAIGSSGAYSYIDGNSLSTAEGQIEINELFIDDNYPLLTMLSMIAPSPDWMVAVNGISLKDTNGDWIQEIVLEVYPYDAGTDSGVDYTSSNMDTNPQDPIASAQGITPFSNEIIGTFTISLIEILNVNDANKTVTNIFPNPATNMVTVSTNSEVLSIQLFNVLGSEVFFRNNINSSSTQIDISDLSSGIYLMKVINKVNETSVKRLIKQ